MKKLDKMSDRELRKELAQARLVCIAFDSADSTDAFENIGHFATARTALEHWKREAHFRKEDECRRHS